MQFDSLAATEGELSLAHRLVCSQFEALVDICEAAQDDGPPPDEPTLERLFVFYDSVFLDHVAAAFQNAAQNQTRVCEVWTGSCHASVKTLADRVKRILRPDHEELRIQWRKATPEETEDDTPAHRQRTYFEASIPPEAITDILARWPDLLLELKSLGMSNRAAVEFSLRQEFAQANRDARDAEVLHAVKTSTPLKNEKERPVATDEVDDVPVDSEPEALPEPSASTGSTKEPWYFTSPPPNEGTDWIGPIDGGPTMFVAWLKTAKVNCSIKSLHSRNGNGTWYVQRIHDRSWKMWLRSQSLYTTVYAAKLSG